MKTIARIWISLLLVVTMVATADKLGRSSHADLDISHPLWLCWVTLPLCLSVPLSFWLRTLVSHCCNGAVAVIYGLLWLLWFLDPNPLVMTLLLLASPVFLVVFGCLWGAALYYRKPRIA